MGMMTTDTLLAIGLEMVGQADTNTVVFAMQIGVTRIGRGGRCMPRCRRGAMTTVANLVASTVEPVELESRPNPAPKAAPLARAIAFTAVAVIALGERTAAVFSVWAAIARVAWYALVGRPGRIHRGKVSWRAIWQAPVADWMVV